MGEVSRLLEDACLLALCLLLYRVTTPTVSIEVDGMSLTIAKEMPRLSERLISTKVVSKGREEALNKST